MRIFTKAAMGDPAKRRRTVRPDEVRCATLHPAAGIRGKWLFCVPSSLLALTLFADVFAAPLPDTGQTKCYDNIAEIPCPAATEPFYGQDGNFRINPPSYTKLSAAGTPLADDAATWTLVRDNVTGLIWENKTSNSALLHGGSRNFTWCDRNPATNGGAEGSCAAASGDAALDTAAFLKATNDSRFGGYEDWRLPTVAELMAIVDRSGVVPAMNETWFPGIGTGGTGSLIYWSAATCAGSTPNAWSLGFYDGHVTGDYGKGLPNAVRAVRGIHSAKRFTDNGDGTVTDRSTGLMWEKQGAAKLDWQSALARMSLLNQTPSLLGGFDDWRLPNITELQSLADYTRHAPALDVALFPLADDLESTSFWSSTTYETYDTIEGSTEKIIDASHAWHIDFSDGSVRYSPKMSPSSVRAVRGGQSQSEGRLLITAPAQSAFWALGKSQTILWDTAGYSGTVTISLSREGGKAGTFAAIISSMPNTGSFTWTVTGPETANSVLRIEPAAMADPARATVQGLFTIARPLSGDVNLDGRIDMADAILIIRAMSRLTTIDGMVSADADVNNDERTNLAEAVFILQKISGLRE